WFLSPFDQAEMDEHQSGNFKIQDIKDCTAVTSAEAARQFFTAQLEDIRMKKGTRKEKGTRQKNDAAAAKEERAIEVGASSSVEAVAAQVQAAEETKAIPQGLLAHDAKE
ncbi:Os09g0449800, partial [Oryza sativa Japonica Group]